MAFPSPALTICAVALSRAITTAALSAAPSAIQSMEKSWHSKETRLVAGHSSSPAETISAHPEHQEPPDPHEPELRRRRLQRRAAAAAHRRRRSRRRLPAPPTQAAWHFLVLPR